MAPLVQQIVDSRYTGKASLSVTSLASHVPPVARNLSTKFYVPDVEETLPSDLIDEPVTEPALTVDRPQSQRARGLTLELFPDRESMGAGAEPQNGQHRQQFEFARVPHLAPRGYFSGIVRDTTMIRRREDPKGCKPNRRIAGSLGGDDLARPESSR
jgi:hypothetical protein